MTNTETRTAHTFVITVENAVQGDTARMRASLADAIRDTAQHLGFRIVPCSWAPDADTIADNVDADDVEVVDLNPSRPIQHVAG